MGLLLASSISWISCTSRAVRTNEWAMKSMPSSMAMLMLVLSRSVSDGRGIFTPGMLTLLRDPSAPPLSAVAWMVLPSMLSMRKSISPSSMRKCTPGTACSAMSIYDRHIRSCEVSPCGFPSKVTLSPALNMMVESSTLVVVRISAPFVSIRIAMDGETARTLLTIFLNPSYDKWAEFILTTLRPLS